MVNNIPPKQTLSGRAETTPVDQSEYAAHQHAEPRLGGLPPPGSLIMHDPSLHGDANAFPVLKAFQDYLETERQQARKRLVTLTAFFVSLMTLVVAGFIMAFIFLLGNQSKREDQQQARQDRLLEEVLQQRKPPEPAPSPAVAKENVTQQLAKEFQATAQALQTNLTSQLATVGEVATRLDSKVDAQNAEVAKLREAFTALQKENASLRTDLPKLAAEAARKAPPPAVATIAPRAAPPATPATAPHAAPPATPATAPHAAPPTTHTPATSTAGTPAAASGKSPKGYDETVLLIRARDSDNNIPWRTFVPR
jgi:hypothetical protein